MKRHSTPAAGVVLSLLLLASTGCSAIKGERVETGMAGPGHSDRVQVTTAPSDPVEGTATATAQADVQPITEWTTQSEAFEFVVPELFSGAPLSGADLYASGPLLITFVSPGCEVSVQAGKEYAEAADNNPSVTFVFVHTGGTADEFTTFAEDADLFQQNVIHVDDSELMLWNRLGIQTQPSTVLVDHNGRSAVSEGGLGHDGLERATNAVTGAV